MYYVWFWNVLNLYVGLGFFLFVCILYVKIMLIFLIGCNNMYICVCNYFIFSFFFIIVERLWIVVVFYYKGWSFS